jgi:hypothetical protein
MSVMQAPCWVQCRTLNLDKGPGFPLGSSQKSKQLPHSVCSKSIKSVKHKHLLTQVILDGRNVKGNRI